MLLTAPAYPKLLGYVWLAVLHAHEPSLAAYLLIVYGELLELHERQQGRREAS